MNYNCAVATFQGAAGVIAFFSLVLLAGILAILIIFARFVGRKARKQGHSFALWCVLGFFLGVFALIMLETGLVSERKGYDFTTYCIIGAFFGIVALFVACLMPDIKNSQTKTTNRVVENTVAQPNASTVQNTERNIKSAPQSSNLLRSAQAASKKTPAKWICPKCGEQNNINAQNCINCYTEKPKN